MSTSAWQGARATQRQQGPWLGRSRPLVSGSPGKASSGEAKGWRRGGRKERGEPSSEPAPPAVPHAPPRLLTALTCHRKHREATSSCNRYDPRDWALQDRHRRPRCGTARPAGAERCAPRSLEPALHLPWAPCEKVTTVEEPRPSAYGGRKRRPKRMAGARVGSRGRSGGGAWAEAVGPERSPPT